MPISYPFKTIFIHIPKCAGTSIEKYLGMATTKQLFSYKKVKDTDLTISNPDWDTLNRPPQHLKAYQLKQLLPNDVFANFYKFSVVRNPYDRFVSEFSYINDAPNEKTAEFMFPSISKFIDAVLPLSEKDKVELFDGHLDYQCDYIYIDRQCAVDQIFKFEDFEQCKDYLKKRTNISADFPHSRASSISPVTLSDDDKTKLYNYYEEDFRLFGYEK